MKPLPVSSDAVAQSAGVAGASAAVSTKENDATSASTAAMATAAAEQYERDHVHGVYEAIASHFSSTRYRPWPAVATFLAAQPAGSVGLDVGCGNGKYLGLNRDVFMVGSDRSAALVALARDKVLLCKSSTRQEEGVQGRAGAGDDVGAAAAPLEKKQGAGDGTDDVLVADGLFLPFRPASADFAICIAVVHHLSTRERRRDAIRQLLGCVRTPTGRVLVFVWALEQKSSRRGWDEGGEQDLLVPWVLKGHYQQQSRGARESAGKGRGVTTAATTLGEEEDRRALMGENQGPQTAAVGPGEGASDSVYRRYYHLYRKGELEEDVVAAGGSVVESGYERDNWWTVAAPT